MSETDVQRAIMSAIPLVPGVRVYDPPANRRRLDKKGNRDHYRAELKHLVAWFETREVGALLWRNNTGAAMLPGGRGPSGLRPVFFGLPGQTDLVGVLKPSGRFLAREIKIPDRSTKKDGTPGASKSNPTIEQRLWGEIFTGLGGDWGVWRSSEEAMEDMRRLMAQEKMLRAA